MAHQGDKRRVGSITEDRVENIMRCLLDEYHKKIDALCEKNIKTGVLEHEKNNGHITNTEKTMMYDSMNYIKNKKEMSALLKWCLSVPLIGLIAERCISYLTHKGP